MFYLNRYKYSKMNNPLNRKDHIMWRATLVHSKRTSVTKHLKYKEMWWQVSGNIMALMCPVTQHICYRGKRLIQIEYENSSLFTELIFIFLWYTPYLSVTHCTYYHDDFVIINLNIKKVLLSWLMIRSCIFHITSSVLGYIMSKHKFEQLYLYNEVLYLSHFGKYYWFTEDSKEIWKLLTAALINCLSEHTAYRKDVSEIVSSR